MTRLLERIKERVRSTTLPRTATLNEIAETESLLGFELPPLLRRLYCEIANGGFGPSNGFFGVPCSNIEADRDLVNQYRAYFLRRVQWPVHLLPVVYLGCDVVFCIDCDDNMNRVIMFDGDLGGLDECDCQLPRSQWPYPNLPLATCFMIRANSLEEFLHLWLTDESQLYRWV